MEGASARLYNNLKHLSVFCKKRKTRTKFNSFKIANAELMTALLAANSQHEDMAVKSLHHFQFCDAFLQALVFGIHFTAITWLRAYNNLYF